ncbi:hypothetical protein HY68_37045 [Streptomyces sp. AcH 505]|nr:hypothetical protein HY68_37045 [Streptomyces sp. AcH 505]
MDQHAIQHNTLATDTARPVFRPRRPLEGPGGLRVQITGPAGQKSQVLRHAQTDATVQATVYVQSFSPSADGGARGVVENNTGTAIFTVDRNTLPNLSRVLHAGSRVTLTGTVTRVGRFATINIRSTRAVAA